MNLVFYLGQAMELANFSKALRAYETHNATTNELEYDINLTMHNVMRARLAPAALRAFELYFEVEPNPTPFSKFVQTGMSLDDVFDVGNHFSNCSFWKILEKSWLTDHEFIGIGMYIPATFIKQTDVFDIMCQRNILGILLLFQQPIV
jgi:hypothetical protein